MIYLLLIIIIILLIKLSFFQNRTNSFSKAFNTPLPDAPYFEKDSPRNKTHPKEFVKFQGSRRMSRKDAIEEASRLEKLYHFLDEERRESMVYHNVYLEENDSVS